MVKSEGFDGRKLSDWEKLYNPIMTSLKEREEFKNAAKKQAKAQKVELEYSQEHQNFVEYLRNCAGRTNLVQIRVFDDLAIIEPGYFAAIGLQVMANMPYFLTRSQIEELKMLHGSFTGNQGELVLYAREGWVDEIIIREAPIDQEWIRDQIQIAQHKAHFETLYLAKNW